MTIMASVQETTSHLEKSVRSEMESARRGLITANKQAVHFVRGNPGTCLLGALAVGFLLGRIAGR